MTFAIVIIAVRSDKHLLQSFDLLFQLEVFFLQICRSAHRDGCKHEVEKDEFVKQ
jgi:hypothetical protein